ncbi:MAG: crcB [Actinomycetia bacterium]|nr:crcB [Actinomycetes bacterium]
MFPWGTLTVNIIGWFVLGALLAASRHGLPSQLMLLLGTGLCGGFTTYSNLSFETVRLLEDGAVRQATGNALGSLTAGIAAATAGYALALVFT